jgi:alpha-2-macroglobulin
MRIHPARLARSVATAALASVLLVSAGCRAKEPVPEDQLSDSADHLRTAQLISHVTDGKVPRNAGISVRFVEVHEQRKTDRQTLSQAFSCTPSITGSAEWTDPRTLVFTPRESLRPGAAYRCALDVAAVLPDLDAGKPFAFSFSVAPNELTAWQAELEPAAENDAERLVYAGYLEFSDPVTLEEIDDNVRLVDGRSEIDLSWRVEPGDRRFWFSSGPITRAASTRTITLEVPADPFGVESSIERSAEIRPLDDLGVVEVEIQNQEAEPRLAVKFSDPLKEGVDLGAYLRVEPHIDLRVSVLGNTLLVSGPFRRELAYTLVVRHGIPSRWDTPMKEDFRRAVRFTDLKPQLSFSQTGSLLPGSSKGTIAFRSLNVRQVTAQVTRVFESNLGQFLQDEGLAATVDHRRFGHQLSRVGVEVASAELDIGETRNTWIQSTLDLSPLLEGHERGLYVVSLSFDKEQMLFDCDDKQRYPYYDHPCGYGYFYNSGRVVRPLMISDIGLLAKQASDRLIVAATHLETAVPLANVEVTLYSYQNQVIARGRTNAKGVAEIATTEHGFYLEGRWRGQRTALKFNESLLGSSGFEVGGVTGSTAPTRAFIYTDRGVYRPGDEIHLAAVVRNQDGGFPDDHPIMLKIRNPKNQVVHSELDRQGLAGHYAFSFATDDDDPTGRWIADLYNGDTLLASHPLRVEMVAPNRLKVRLDLPKKLGPETGEVAIGLESSYLFGAPASGLRGTLEVVTRGTEKTFDAFPDYTFTHPARFLSATTDRLFDGPLDSDGHAVIDWKPPTLTDAPSAVVATLTARVFERGGRPTTEAVAIPVDPYDAYVGLRRPLNNWTALNQPLPLTVVLVAADGKPIRGRELEVAVYTNERNWWWEYRSFDDYRRRFKSDVQTRLVDSLTVTTAGQPATVNYTPSHHGQVLIEVRDPQGGHVAGTFVWVSSWGSSRGPLEAGTQLEMEVDRETYNPGDTARVTVKTPSEGIAFVSLEKAGEVLSHHWQPLVAEQTTIEFGITEEMLPNVYLHVTAVQPHAQTANDRPIRLYGVVPLAVEKASTRLPVEVVAPTELKPLQTFEVEVKVPRDRSSTVTVAVVDEGLLDLTSFETPNPWAFFFAKERLSVASFDVYGSVIGALWGEIDRRFEIGGDEDSYRKGQAGPVKARRFPPVALFAEPVRTDGSGRARFSFKMPHYMGSVRVMAVAASGSSYGSAESSVPVREKIIVLPSLPRVAGPGETFDMPVTIFATADGIGATEVTVETTGPLAVSGPNRTVIDLDTVGEKDLGFTLAATQAAGVATVRVTAAAKGTEAFASTELAVRPINPTISSSKELAIAAGASAAFTVPELGLPGTRRASIRISPMPGITFGHRLEYLIRYPYGCMEQTMSAVFPQLYLKHIFEPTDVESESRRIDANIDAGIQRLQRFRTPDGGFGYWPGATTTDEWATNYGGHYLLEASRLGYHVPSDLMDSWMAFQRRMAARESGNSATRSYRLFLLALAGEPMVSAMNLLAEEKLDTMDNLSKWLLASGYKLAGMDQAAHRILATATTEVKPYRELGGTYGSATRDHAMMLYLATKLDRPEVALDLYHELAPILGGRGYLSTHSAGYALLAVGNYLDWTWRADTEVRGRLTVAGKGGLDRKFARSGGAVTIDLTEHTGREITIDSSSEAPIFVAFEWQGIPVQGPTEPEARNLSLDVRWLDEDGNPIDPSPLTQGTLFWGHFRVASKFGGRLENLALTQIVPSGWEIDATRLRGEQTPDWAGSFTLGNATYTDIRDDRVMWFFDLNHRPMDFLVKLMVVTRGEFVLAPTLVEAMYDDDFRALVPGGPVEVVAAEGP